MARHAGFAAVASVDEDTVNKILATYFRQVQGPYFLPMPTTLGAGASAVTFAGVVGLDPPTVELHANPANLITTHFVFRTTLKAQPAGGTMQTWTLQLSGTGTTVLVTQIVNNQVVLTLSAAQTTIAPLAVAVLAGPPLPPAVRNALQSAALAAMLTTFVRAVVPFIASPPLLTTQYSQAQKGDFKDSNFSVFEWFRVSVAATRVVARPLEKALAVGVDFFGLSNGDPNQLVDLTAVRGNGRVYYRTVYPATDPNAAPIVQSTSVPAGSAIAVAFNMSVISQIVASQVSPKVAGTPIRKDTVLNSLALGYSSFVKPLRGTEDGLQLHFNVTARGITANGYAYIQPMLQTYDGPTNFLKPDSWSMFVALVDVDLPFWVELLIGIAEFVFALLSLIALMVTMFNLSIHQLVADFTQSVVDALSQADAGNIGATAQGSLQGAANGISLPAPWSKPLSGTNFPRWDGMIHYCSVNAESLDVGVKTWINWDDAAEQPPAVIAPGAWSATDRRDIPLSLTLRSDLAKLAGNNLMLVWQVTRNDTGATVVTATNRYDASPRNGPAIPHHSEALYLVAGFTVRCTATITLGGQVGEIWSGKQVLTIDDNLDRSHSFVEWGPHTVFFPAPDYTIENPNYWTHTRRSRIHRTAVAARCRMLKLKAAAIAAKEKKGMGRTPLRYRDDLGFPWEDLVRHRKVLCEYCFFGGPDKIIPYDRNDWFEPVPGFVIGLKPHHP